VAYKEQKMEFLQRPARIRKPQYRSGERCCGGHYKDVELETIRTIILSEDE
jgi:hypothetical protein